MGIVVLGILLCGGQWGGGHEEERELCILIGGLFHCSMSEQDCRFLFPDDLSKNSREQRTVFSHECFHERKFVRKFFSIVFKTRKIRRQGGRS